jgi:UDP-3-O-[3-hydroxymyristoyl] glucosamine N-acyltransferase
VAKISAIARLVGAPEPAVDSEVLHVSSIEAASETSLVFAMDAMTLDAALNSVAAVVLTQTRLLPDAGKIDPRILTVSDPRYAFARAAQFLQKLSTGEADVSLPPIHRTAVIDTTASIGRNTHIGAHTVIGHGVEIGAQCVIHSNVTIHAQVTLGDRVVVQSGAVLGSSGFGYARDPDTGSYLLFPQQGTLAIEDDVEVGANTTIDRGALGETRIGSGTKIDNLVHIAHNCRVGRNVIIAAQTGVSGSSVIEDGAILGGQVGLGEHAHVGAGVILGGGAGVLSHKKVRGEGQVFWGRPARPLKQYLRDLARLSRR